MEEIVQLFSVYSQSEKDTTVREQVVDRNCEKTFIIYTLTLHASTISVATPSKGGNVWRCIEMVRHCYTIVEG